LKLRYYLIPILIIFAHTSLYAQEGYYTKTVSDTFLIRLDNKYLLSQISIIPFSETIRLKGKILAFNQYRIHYSESSLSLSDSLPYSIYDTVIVSYKAVRLSLQKEYKNRSLVTRYDDKTKDTLRAVQEESKGFSSENIFGKGIEKSGTIVRGFTVGTTKDFSLNSGFRLQLAGKLADNIELVAALTDENQPIQPEGNTERLDELDKVFIQIKHPNAALVFGDYVLTKKTGEFGNVDRKLQGLSGEFNYAGTEAYFAIANSKGKYNNNKFNGTDGVQGPYKLSGVNGEQDIIIIAGTEKVYLDGEEMKRGEANDYTIDYSNAQVTFTTKRLITSASRITIDFQYSSQQYSRNFFASGVQTKLMDNKLGIKFQYLREGDDPNAPIDVTLSDSDKKILAAAGNDRQKAVKTGISIADLDSLGQRKGSYCKIDTAISGQAYTYYYYSPGSAEAIYNVSFSYVGESTGDYIKESLGNYKFVGIKAGNYNPIIFLPMPELKQIGNLLIEGNPTKDLYLNVEFAGSIWDKNRLSSVGDNDNNGIAANFFINLNPQQLKIGNTDFGKYGFSYKERYVQSAFTSPDRLNSVEFNRDYNIQTTETGDERLREFSLKAQPIQPVNLSLSYGYLKKGDDFVSKRLNNTVIVEANKNSSFEYNLDYVSTDNVSLVSKWYKHKASMFYKISSIFKPGIEFLAEDKKDNGLITDSLLSSSLRYQEYDPFVEVSSLYGVKIKAKYSFRKDDLPLNGVLVNESRSTGEEVEIGYAGVKEVNTNLKFTLREKTYSDAYKTQGQLNTQTILIKSQTKFNFWNRLFDGDLYYEVSTQKSAKLEKVFVRVQQGTGNYKYLGDLNNNGIADENEFEPTLFDGDYVVTTVPTQELYPVIDLKTSTRWKIKWGDFAKTGTMNTILKSVTSETSWKIEENSTDTDLKNIYLLKLNTFQNEKNTIHGSNTVQQDVFLFENDPALSFRFRYSQRKSLSQYYTSAERGYYRERSVRINFKMVEEISNQTDILYEDNNILAGASSNRNMIVNNSSLTSDFSYRPEKNIEVGFKFKVGQSIDNFPTKPTTINLNSQLIRLNVSFAGDGRLRIEFERDELGGKTNDNYIPFEITSGNLLGKNYFGRLSFDYKLANNLLSSVNYEGRNQGGGATIHTARAEVRAYF